MKRFIKHTTLVLLILFSSYSFAQPSKRQRLEARKTQLKKDIVYLKALRSNNQRREKNLLKEVKDLNNKINVQSKLVATIKDEESAISHEIIVNNNEIDALEEEITDLKTAYSKIVLQSYKSRSQQSRMLFVLSSSSFMQAYKRFQYIKQYNTYRKKKVESIQENSLALQRLNDSLQVKRNIKENLVNESVATQKNIEKDKSKQEKLIARAQSKQEKYLKEIKKRVKAQQRVDRQIENLIKNAIVSSNLKTGKKPVKGKKHTTFSLTPEAKILANKFTANKGELPWPVAKGVVTMRYGTQPHPILKSLKIQSNGVRITTEKGMKARAIFDGKVLAIRVSESTGIKTVMLQHGNYITVYENLTNVVVKKGDAVKTKQTLGTIHTDAVNDETVLKFQLWKESAIQNPAPWILRM